MPEQQEGGRNVARKLEICRDALGDVETVLNAIQGQMQQSGTFPQVQKEAYKEFFCVLSDPPEGAFFGAHRTRELMRRICKAKEYEVQFVRLRRGPGNVPALDNDLKGFVSWLVVKEKKKKLVVTYDGNRIRKIAGDNVLAANIALAKVFLHECGHAILHLDDFLKRQKTSGKHNPSLDKEHEEEAWLYSLVIWAVLTGAHSYAQRDRGRPDDGFRYA